MVRMEGGSGALVVILSSCVVVVLYCHQVVIMVPGVSELCWDELGMGGAHCSLFGCHITGGVVAPASLVSVGHFCACGCPLAFVLGCWSLLGRSCSLLVLLWLLSSHIITHELGMG